MNEVKVNTKKPGDPKLGLAIIIALPLLVPLNIIAWKIAMSIG